VSDGPHDARGAISRFLGNTAWAIAAQVVAKAAGIVLFAAVARSVSKEDFGYFAFALSFTPLFLKFGADGVNIVLVREIARDRAGMPNLLRNALILRTQLDAVAFLLVSTAAYFMVDDARGYAAVLIVGTAWLVDDFTSIHLSVFKAFEKMQLFAIVDGTNRIASALLVVSVALLGGDLIALCITYLAGSVLALLVARGLLSRRFASRRSPVLGTASRLALLRSSLPIGLAALLAVGVFRIDMVMLQAIKGPAEVAIYGAAYVIFEAVLGLSWSITSALLPTLSRVRHPMERIAIFKVAATTIVAVYVPLAILLPVISGWIVTGLYSDRYLAAESVLAVLAGAALCNAVANLAQTSAIVLGRGREIVAIAAVLLLVNVGMNLFAIPHYGFRGAAVTTLITEVLSAALLLGLFVYDNQAAARYAGLIGMSAVAAASVGVFAIDGDLDPVPAALAAGLSLTAFGVAARELGPDERHALARFARRGRGEAVSPALDESGR
jgi:O-antigen/teichoic acid export membrane protein